MRATGEDIDRVRGVLYRATGVVLGQDKGYLVRSLLAPIAYEVGNGTLAGVLEVLDQEPGGALEQEVVETLLNNETWFFRDHHVFAALRRDVLPTLERSEHRPLRIWSAACSSGQEPYSIAMIAHHFFPELWPHVEVFATDISERVLARARSAVFTQLEINRGLPAPMLVRYFEEEGPNWRVRSGLSERVEFSRLSLNGEWPELPEMDVVFLRNVLLYFDPETRSKVLDRVRRVLRPDGFLVLGAAEATFPHQDSFAVQSCGDAAYYRVRALEV